MKFPQWVLDFKKKGTEIRFLNNYYYLYEISSHYDKEKKRAVKKTGKFLGKITQDGIVPPKTDRLKANLKNLSVKEYGASQLIYNMNKDIVSSLKQFFPYNWKELFSIALLRLIYQSHLRYLESYYTTSYISELIPGAKLKEKSITAMLKQVGTQRQAIVDFFKGFVAGTDIALVDVTSILSNSENMSINQLGYNNKKIYDPQVNLLFMFSQDKQMPVYYRILPGNVREISAFKLSIEESGIDNAVIITDKGFYSEDNVIAIEKEKLNFIIPLRRNLSIIDYNKIAKGDKSKFDGFFMFENRPVWYYSYIVDNKKMFIFLDEHLKSSEESDYLLRMTNEKEGYSKDDFFLKQYRFGTIAVLSNLVNESDEKIYQYLKSRMEIETLFDTLKNNLHADRSYMRGAIELETWMFINYLSLIFYYRIYHNLVKEEKIKKYSPQGVLLYMSLIKKILIDNEWKIAEIPKKSKEFIDLFGMHIT